MNFLLVLSLEERNRLFRVKGSGPRLQDGRESRHQRGFGGA